MRVTALSHTVEDCRLDAAEHLLQHGSARTTTKEYGKSLLEAAGERNDYRPYAFRAKMRALLAR